MRGRHFETIAVGALGSLFGAALFAILHDALALIIGRQLSLLEIYAGLVFVAALSFILASWLWRRWHSMRCRILAFSQRRIAHLACVVILGELIGVTAGYALATFGIPPALSLPAVPSLFLLAAFGLLVWLASGLLIYGVLRRFGRPEVTAAQCFYVLRIVARERAAGGARFPFLEDAPAFEIRRQCRILDLLAFHPDSAPLVVSRLWTYRINPEDGIPADQPATVGAPPSAAPRPAATPQPGGQPAGSRAPTAADGLDPAANKLRKHEQDAYASAVHTLMASANKLCQDGAARKWWSRAGADLSSLPDQLYATPFFGNKLDYLFNGGDGYRVGGVDGPRFITMVIKGPPGAGKSTAALQLCTTLARHGNICIYYSLEEEREGLFATASDFGWQPEDNAYFPSDGEAKYHGVLIQKVIYNRFNMVKRQGVKPRINELLDLGTSSPLARQRGRSKRGRSRRASRADTNQPAQRRAGAVLVSSLGNRAMAVKDRMKQLQREWEELPDVLPRCVVIDSLEGFANVGLRGDSEDDTSPSGKPGVLRSDFLKIKDFFRNRCDMLVVAVEDDGSGKPGYVDFVADTVIQLGRRRDDNYVLLSAEVRKARNQMHALGQHQVKFRSLRDIKRASIASAATGDDPRSAEHGILVYPSLDYVLSQSRGQPVFDEHTLSTGFHGLDSLLGADRAGGMKRQSSAALLGPGTTGKSLIAMNFLIEGVRENRPSLLLSLRDDIGIITSKPHPQERGRMRFSWRKGFNDETFHQLEWPVSSIRDWLITRRAPSVSDPIELPYFLRDQSGWRNPEISTALIEYLDAVVTSCPSDGTAWSQDARSTLATSWDAFALRAGDTLAVVEDPEHPGTLIAQHPIPDVAGGVPLLRWTSHAEKLSGADEQPNQIKYLNDLLVVKSWRPGNIAPEDFLNWLLGVIGKPKEPTRFSRVVFDDVSQLNQRFPLLAESRLFLPTLVDLFKAKHIASIFLAGYDDQQGAPTGSGLDVLADHVIRTRIRGPDMSHRTIEVDVDTRPGSRRLPPHELVIDDDSEFVDIRPIQDIANT